MTIWGILMALLLATGDARGQEHRGAGGEQAPAKEQESLAPAQEAAPEHPGQVRAYLLKHGTKLNNMAPLPADLTAILVDLLDDPSLDVRTFASIALSKMKDASLALIAALPKSSLTKRNYLIQILARLGEPALLYTLDAAASSNTAVRDSALTVLSIMSERNTKSEPQLKLTEFVDHQFKGAKQMAQQMIDGSPSKTNKNKVKAHPALPILVQSLKSSDSLVVENAIKVIESLGKEAHSIIPELENIAQDPLTHVDNYNRRFAIRTKIIDALGSMGRGGADVSNVLIGLAHKGLLFDQVVDKFTSMEKESIRPLIATLHSPDPGLRLTALKIITELGYRSSSSKILRLAIPDLNKIAHTTSKGREERTTALVALSPLGEKIKPTDQAMLIEELKASKDPDAKVGIVRALSNSQPTVESMNALVDVFSDREADYDVLAHILDGIKTNRLKTKQISDTMFKLVEHSAKAQLAYLLSNALSALAAAESDESNTRLSPRARDVIIDYIDHKDEIVRVAAIDLVERYQQTENIKAAIPKLLSSFEKYSTSESFRALETAVDIGKGSSEVKKFLIKSALSNSGWPSNFALAKLATNYRSPEAIDAIRTRLNDNPSNLYGIRGATTAASQLGTDGEALLPDLKKLQQNSDTFIRQYARDAIGTIEEQLAEKSRKAKPATN